MSIGRFLLLSFLCSSSAFAMLNDNNNEEPIGGIPMKERSALKEYDVPPLTGNSNDGAKAAELTKPESMRESGREYAKAQEIHEPSTGQKTSRESLKLNNPGDDNAKTHFLKVKELAEAGDNGAQMKLAALDTVRF